MTKDCTIETCQPWLREVDWDMIQEDAVTMYLEWGNNNFRDLARLPVRGSDDYSVYFVVDTWDEPKAVLMRMTKWGSESLCEKKLPPELAESFLKERGKLRGIHELTDEVRAWLKELLKA